MLSAMIKGCARISDRCAVGVVLTRTDSALHPSAETDGPDAMGNDGQQRPNAERSGHLKGVLITGLGIRKNQVDRENDHTSTQWHRGIGFPAVTPHEKDEFSAARNVMRIASSWTLFHVAMVGSTRQSIKPHTKRSLV